MPHIWRSIYKFCGVYDWYPEKIPEEQINLKNKMLEELKQVHESHFQYKNKLKYDNVIHQLKLINSKTNTLDMLVNLNIKLI
jgi:hypothetical protein